MRNASLLLLCCALLAAVPGVLCAWPQNGEVAPDFAVQDTAWNTRTLAGYRGDVVFLYFWRTDVPACTARLSRVESMYDDYSVYNFSVLAVNPGQDINIIRTIARRWSFQFFRDSGAAWDVYRHADSLPTCYVIDSSGAVVYSSGVFDEDILRAFIESALPPTGIAEPSLVATTVPGSGPVVLSPDYAGVTDIRIRNSSGRLVRTLTGSTTWDLRDRRGLLVPAGIYYAELRTRHGLRGVRVTVLR